MPHYYYHIKFEIYQTPATRYKGEPGNSSRSIWTPSRTTDIFKTPFPAHRTSRWTSDSFPIHSPDSRRALTNVDKSQPGKTLLLPERNPYLQHQTPTSPQLKPVRLSNHQAAHDWRYGRVSVESINMEQKSRVSHTPVPGLHTKARFVPSDPAATDIGWGVVHLYRDAEEHEVDTSVQSHSQAQHGGKLDEQDCSTLCILAVPSWMMPSDLLGFVGDQAREDVSHFRLIRTGRANKYMALMKFRSAKKAQDWQKENNGRLFSAAEPENCHVVFVKSVEFVSPDTANFPENNYDAFTTPSLSTSSKPFAPPPPDLNELPTCPVCLERMDDTTGLLTILCQHVFHCTCLEKWQGSGCPVCRYTHSPSYTFPYPRPQADNSVEDLEPMCSVCATTANVWVCLICGNLGCGRYDSAHAQQHYQETSHCYAMDIGTQRVWDYAGDGYVHRLIQSKPEGRIDLPERTRHANEAFRAEGSDSVPREKMENMATEYTFLLTSQLEGQRRYFEEQVERAVDKAAQASARIEELAVTTSALSQRLEDKTAEVNGLRESLSTLEKVLERSEKAREKSEKLARAMSSSLREEQTMNEGLLQSVKVANEKAQEAKSSAEKAMQEKKELEEMNHDLTMFISSQEKVKELQAQGEEVLEGNSGVQDGPNKKKKGRKK